jgi:hypothetical protein
LTYLPYLIYLLFPTVAGGGGGGGANEYESDGGAGGGEGGMSMSGQIIRIDVSKGAKHAVSRSNDQSVILAVPLSL